MIFFFFSGQRRNENCQEKEAYRVVHFAVISITEGNITNMEDS